MSDARDEDIDFSWGSKKGRSGLYKDVQLYESFTYGGVEYFLYDSVYLYKDGEIKPCIGKLIEICELPSKARKVKLLCFFHPSDLSNYIGGENVLQNEIFLASGCGEGLMTINPLEAIAGKCNVVCISSDPRNQNPLAEEVKAAEYVFYRTFDVRYHTISDILGEKIAAIEVKFLLNKNVFELSDHAKVDSGNVLAYKDNPFLSVEGTLVGGNVVENNTLVSYQMLNDDKAANNLVENSKCLSVGYRDDTDLMEEIKNSDKGSFGRSAVVSCDAGLGSSRSDNADLVDLRATQVVVGSGQGIKLRSSDPEEVDADLNSAQTTKASQSSSKLGKAVKALDEQAKNGVLKSVDLGKRNAIFRGVKHQKPINLSGVLEVKSLKERKLRAIAPSPCDDDGASIKMAAAIPAVTSTASLPGFSAAGETNNNGKIGRQLIYKSSGISTKLKFDSKIVDESVDKLHNLSTKQSKVWEKSAMSGGSKMALQFDGDVGNSDRSLLDRDASYGLPKEMNIEEESGSKLCNEVAILSKQKSILSASTSNKAPQHDTLENNDKRNLVKEIKADGHIKEVTLRQTNGSRWMTASTVYWEERLKKAHDRGTLVLLENLDPSYTSIEVESIIWHGFGFDCTGKIVPHTAISSPHSGQAFVIFKTPETASNIVWLLNEKNLMLPNGRPLVGSIGVLSFSGKQSSFPGHVTVDKLRHQMSRDSREAVSTSHFTQPNNLEHELALNWCVLQKRSNWWWEKFHKAQREDIDKLKTMLKS